MLLNQLYSFSIHCCSRRDLSFKNLNGTIEPDLGNLTQITELYVQLALAIYDLF